MKKPTQTEKVLKHLTKIGPLDQITALRNYGIMRLASRVSEMNKAAPAPIIAKRMKPVKCKDGSTAYVAEYRLIKKQEAQPA